ncbi:MAG: tRNA (adenosine(37)-N6)-threonylcarbamoyltransferase complex ATPase subunit type 1 TsaE [Clostridia bacterium]|nr:tRNA (adenosine(37)-N6)-threonylcarbamoyltransferase complex ATPase subunit type 1 TsaE [Clostridia bacterium]MBR2327321.1 tRNA (adenosine(37)-N6)-threonylcarbamoyltransferase complex ATPase subunit type 1 TsaE [Clostridia bacterium]
MEKRFISNSPKETADIAASLVSDKTVKKGDFVALTGDLGAGKTAFVRGLVAGIFCTYGGKDKTDEVLSPTFSIMNIYESAVPVWHCDFYRIRGEDDLYMTGFYDCDENEVIVAAEWSENIPFAVPKSAVFVNICGSGTVREITVSKK